MKTWIQARSHNTRNLEAYSIMLPCGRFSVEIPMGRKRVKARTIMSYHDYGFESVKTVSVREARKRFYRGALGMLHEAGTLSTAQFQRSLDMLNG